VFASSGNPRFRQWSQAAQPRGYPDAIVETVAGTANARVAAVVKGAADLATQLSEGQPSAAVTQAVRTKHADLVEINPWPITWYLALNTRIAPFDDLRARRALDFALDRQRLLDLTVGQGFGRVTCQVLPPNFVGYRPYCPYTADPGGAKPWSDPEQQQARRLVRASDIAGRSVTVWLPSYTEFGPAAARYVVAVLDSLGYKARFRLTASTTPSNAQISFAGWYADYPTPGGFVAPTLTCAAVNGVNVARFCDPAVDHQIARAQSLEISDPQAAYALWARIDREITDQAPWVSFANGDEFELRSARAGNYQLNPQWGALLDQIWVR